MNPFDENYMARREKQIQELFVLRALSRAFMLVSGALIVGMIIAAVLQQGTLVGILAVIAIPLALASCITWVIAQAQAAAEVAIQAEREKVLTLYTQSLDKPKRSESVRLSDDGELVDENFEARRNAESNHR